MRCDSGSKKLQNQRVIHAEKNMLRQQFGSRGVQALKGRLTSGSSALAHESRVLDLFILVLLSTICALPSVSHSGYNDITSSVKT